MSDLNLPQPGSRAKLTCKDAVFEGVLLPSESSTIVLKLDSGYNVGILPEHVIEIAVLAQPQPTRRVSSPVKHNEALPTIALIHTGGTIASRIDYKTGGVSADFTPEELLELYPELQNIANVKAILTRNIMSDDLRLHHINLVAEEIFTQVKSGIDKCIVTSGTDFLHYLATGLAFVLKDVPVSVCVVGAQRSSDRGSSDSFMNLFCATQFLAQTDHHGVTVCMHESIADTTCAIIPAVNVKKMHSSRRDAFQSINVQTLATVSYPEGEVRKNPHLLPSRASGKKDVPAALALFNPDLKIGMCYSHPHMYAKELAVFADFDGLVLVGAGLGSFPIHEVDDMTAEHTQIRSTIQTLAQTMPVVMSTQTVNGRVHLQVYSGGREMQQLGVLGHLNAMIAETTFIKLAWLLSNYNKEDVPALLMQDLIGEQPDYINN